MTSTRPPLTVILLALTALLAPIIGGHINLEASTLGPGFGALLFSVFRGSDTPTYANLLAALGALTCVMVLVIKRRVLQIPTGKSGLALFAFIGLITVSILVSNFKDISVAAWAQWVIYCLVFFAAASGAGRLIGPRIVLGAFVLGCGFTALTGLYEWQQHRALDPTWRIFANWNNPNALAGILIIGLMIGLAMTLSEKRLVSLVLGAATGLIAFALFLTQSRGGLLAAGVGTLLFFAAAFFQNSGALRKDLVKPLVSLLFGALLVFGAIHSSKSADGAIGSRLGSNTSATEQSTGFRKLLWKGALSTMKANPVGRGIGAYPFASTESGLVQETKLTHNTLLQLGVEASVLAPVAFLAFLFMWASTILKGRRTEPELSVLRLGVALAILVAMMDGLFESNLYFYGIGISFFLLLGIGNQLAADAVTPEFTPPLMRRSMGAGVIVVVVILLTFGYREQLKAQVRYAKAAAPEDYSNSLSALRSFADDDGEAHYLLAFDPSLSPEARVNELQLAADYEPSSKHLRSLAETVEQTDKPSHAEEIYQQALQHDPNNLLTLSRLMQFDDKQGNTEVALALARRIQAIEDTPYFKIRALSEVVPLETADARVYIAGHTTDKTEVADEFAAAAKVYGDFATTSVPYFTKVWVGSTQQDMISGESPESMLQKLDQGIQITKSAIVAAKQIGRDTAPLEQQLASMQAIQSKAVQDLGGNK